MLETNQSARKIQYVVSCEDQILLITTNYKLATLLEGALKEQGYPKGYRLTIWDGEEPT